MRRVLLVPAVLAALAGCGEDTPRGREAASPADRVAAPAPGDDEAVRADRDMPAPDPDEAEEAPVPRAGAPGAIGDAPERAAQPVVPDPPRSER